MVTKAKTSTSTRKKRESGTVAKDGISTYSSALKWLSEHTDYERQRVVRYNTTTFNLDRMRKLLRLLGSPESQIRTIHIAGSKGKGSTCAMLDSMLRNGGVTVGLFTSPHLIDIRERIQVNGEMIPKEKLTDLFKFVESKGSRMGKDKPTFFEIITAAALRHFMDEAVDLAIIETGLGGRLDSTNVIEPEVCGITQISHDHTNVLGTDLKQIAAEKAGIFKPGIPAVSVPQDPDVQTVLMEKAAEVGTSLEILNEQLEFSYRFEASRELGPHTRVCLTTPNAQYEHLPVPLQGEHQALNCGLALAILDRLRTKGFDIPEQKITEGLASTGLPGRMEIVWNEPRILLDGAHNASSIQALVKAIGAHIPYDSLVMIFGCGADKDIAGMLKGVNYGADKIIFTRSASNPRAIDPTELLTQFEEVSGKMAQVANNLEDAFNLAARAVSREDLICVTGSFHLIGEAKKYLLDLAEKRRKQQ